ncbi:MAG: Eco57I restriction-modification methylase domain-containing protein, partial [Phycisphaerales bacterium JB038]
MAKPKSGQSGYQDPHDDLFARIEDRKRRRLFLPSILDAKAADTRLETNDREKAYEVIKRWWDLARSGALNRKETSIDDRFLSEVFGEALGYRGVTESSQKWERERQFSIPGVGPCDGALGLFPPNGPESVRVVIELKGASAHLDRDKFNGRTAVQQVWDYLNAMPETCVWGVVSNFTTIRLYHRSKGSQVYEQFRLHELAEDRGAFNRLYAVFEPYGLIKALGKEDPRAIALLERSADQQRQVGDVLYETYSEHRLRLIRHLHDDKGLDLDEAIRVAQKLIDRVLFIAFCEDRGLIVEEAIDKAYKTVPMFSKVRNPRWQNFLGLFHEMDKGGPGLQLENGYNGGLFREDDLIDSLDLDDEPWTTFFRSLGGYDYEHEVNVDVLGHLFEKSITELERLREGALFAQTLEQIHAPMMPKSPQRKLFGVYYTPVDFTAAIVQYTVDEVIEERFAALRDELGVSQGELDSGKVTKAQLRAYWEGCLECLKSLRICDPACGSGAFLIQAYESLLGHYGVVITELEHVGLRKAGTLLDGVPELILSQNLYGVDLQQEAVEIAQLSLWLRTARVGKTLADLSKNIVCGNSLTDDPSVDAHALNWREQFPEVFVEKEDPGFDCVIGNPPWERVKVQTREFFALSAPEIASTVNAADRKKAIKKLAGTNPELHAKFCEAIEAADRVLADARSGRYPLTGKGDINTYMLFAELATTIVAPTGRVGLLVPSGIATDKTTAKFFNSLMEGRRLQRLYDFENRRRIFQDVDGRFKFSVLNFGGEKASFEQADFVFFGHSLDELRDKQRHVPLSQADMRVMNPNTKTCPIFRDRRSAEITRGIYERVQVLIDRNREEGGNPWGVRFATMFHQTNDAKLFQTPAAMRKRRYRLEGNRWVRGQKTYLPLYEAKMIQAYDHRAASVEVVKGNWMRQGQTDRKST